METLKSWWIGLLHFGFRLLYYELAWTYDVVSWVVSLGEWRRWQRASLAYLPPSDFQRPLNLLEIGHGPGHMFRYEVALGFRVTAIDLSPHMGRIARRRLQRQRLGHAVALVRTAVPDLPFADGTFAAVLSQFPTPYIIEPGTPAALFRMLRPGGRVVILPEGHLTGRTPLHQLIAWLFKITGQTVDAPSEVTDVNLLWSKWIEQYHAAGFHVKIEQVALPRSALTVLMAIKPEGVLNE